MTFLVSCLILCHLVQVIPPTSMFISHSMILPYDALFELFPCLRRSDASKLMRTCKTLYHHGSRRLLEEVVPVFDTNLCSLSLFFEADMTRCKYLHDLFICPNLGDPDVYMRTFARVLQNATNLRVLTILGSILDTYPSILSAVMDLSSIQTLKLGYWLKAAPLMMLKLRSPVF